MLIPTLEKFYVPYGGTTADREKHKEFVNITLKELQNIFQAARIRYSYHQAIHHDTPFLYPSILPEIFQSVTDYQEPDFLYNRTLSLPFYKIEFLTWVLYLAQQLVTRDSNIILSVTAALLRTYLDSINQKEVEALDFHTNEFAPQIPHWTAYKEGIKGIDWAATCIAFARENQLDAFLSPSSLVFIATPDPYHEMNRFTVDKFRTHLAILILAYSSLYESSNRLQLEGQYVKGILCSLEQKITSVVSWYCIQDEARARVDIFDRIFEGTILADPDKELLPDIGHTINTFSDENKRKIISELLTNNQLLRSLKLLEYVVSEEERQTLLATINPEMIAQEIGKFNWSETEYALMQLADYEKFKDKIREVLDGYQEMIFRKRGPWREAALATFRIKLLLAYQEEKEDEFNKIKAPDFKSYNGHTINPQSERDFYCALLFLKRDEPTKAHDLFNHWIGHFDDQRPTWALNRFASANRAAQKQGAIDKRKELYYAAAKEWLGFEDSLKPDVSLEYIKEKIWYNKLEAWDGSQMDPDFDEQYFKLEKVIQLRPEFIKLTVRSYVRRNMHVQALALLNEAEQYHRLSTGALPDFISELRQIAYDKTAEDYLRQQYDMIFSSPPETLVKIAHRNINKYDTLPLFILQELSSAASDMLQYVNSISSIKIEDKYSDLLTLALSNRLINYGWAIGPARGGVSESKKRNPGEIDFSINTKRERICICEAMILKGKNTAVQQSHSFKVYNYDPRRNFIFLIVYYLGSPNHFQRDWDIYRSNCSKVVKFPRKFKLEASGWKDLPDFSHDTLKAGQTTHSNGTTMYHLFINIDYVLTNVARKSKTKKKRSQKKRSS